MRIDPNSCAVSLEENRFWAAVHDIAAHPLLVLTCYSAPAKKFHDWTSARAWPRPDLVVEPWLGKIVLRSDPGQIRDPIERIVAEALDRAGIRYERNVPVGGRALDFYLVDRGMYIECKQFHSDRSAAQLATASDIILIQGREAALAFRDMITVHKW